jgi:hypothetical protein
MRALSWFGATRSATLLAMTALFAACGGGGGYAAPGAPSAPLQTASPAPTAPPQGGPGTLTVSTANPASASLGPTADGYSGSITVPPGSTAAILTVGFSSTQPAGTPVVQSARRLPKAIGGQGLSVLTFVTVTPNTTVSFAASPAFTVTLPALPTRQTFSYIAGYDPSNAAQGWQVLSTNPAMESGTLLTFPGTPSNATLTGGVTYDFAVFSVDVQLN